MQEEVHAISRLITASDGDICTPHLPEKDDIDPLGDKIGKIYIKTSQFMIYTADNSARDFGRLRHMFFSPNYEACRELREKLSPTVGPIARITDIVCGMRPIFRVPRQRIEAFESLTERCLVLMAKAMQVALEGKPEWATEMLEGLHQDIALRRDSGNRMRYIFANAMALLIIGLAWAAAQVWGDVSPGVITEFFSGAAPATSVQLQFLDVLMFGAIGAFFAVSIGLKDVHVGHSISVSEMLYAGFIRVPIGIIAASVVILLISGGWILNNWAHGVKPWSYCLFGFIAGFSELFVPNTLKQVETGSRVKAAESRLSEPSTKG